MSVLLVTDDVDDSIRNYSIVNHQEHIYKQIKELEYDLSSVRSFSILDYSSSIFDKSNKYYRQHRRRRRCRPQQCLVQHLLTYMLTLLILTNHLHWPVIFLSLSSIKIMSTHASMITATTILTSSSSTTTNQTITIRPLITPSTTKLSFKEDEQQCLTIGVSAVDRLCSKTCRARKTPFETFDSLDQISTDMYYLPFCSHILTHNVFKEDFFIETTEKNCRQTLNEILEADYEAQKAFQLFGGYMQAIDSASDDNRYSIITADCEAAYRVWTCSVLIPYYKGKHRISPCQTICDEVERVCPTFRPSDREPSFAGQPLFFCNGIVANSDYNQPPHCFDTCHLFNGTLQRPSSLTVAIFNKTYSSTPSIAAGIQNHVTTPKCFDIEPLLPSSSEQPTSSLVSVDESIFGNTSNTSLSASAITIISSSWSSIILTFILILKTNYIDG